MKHNKNAKILLPPFNLILEMGLKSFPLLLYCLLMRCNFSKKISTRINHINKLANRAASSMLPIPNHVRKIPVTKVATP